MHESTAKLIAEYEARIALMKQEDGVTTFQSLCPSFNIWIFADGKGNGTEPDWNFQNREYRVKPKPAEAWAWKYPNGDLGECLYKEKLEPSMVETGRVMVLMREVIND